MEGSSWVLLEQWWRLKEWIYYHLLHLTMYIFFKYRQLNKSHPLHHTDKRTPLYNRFEEEFERKMSGIHIKHQYLYEKNRNIYFIPFKRKRLSKKDQRNQKRKIAFFFHQQHSLYWLQHRHYSSHVTGIERPLQEVWNELRILKGHLGSTVWPHREVAMEGVVWHRSSKCCRLVWMVIREGR